MLGVTNEETCGPLMKDVLYKLKSVVNEEKFFKGIETEETFSALMRLITNVLFSCNSETSILALRCLKFLVHTLSASEFEKHKSQLYGVILRALSYRYELIGFRQSDDMLLVLFKVLKIMLEKGILPGLIAKHYEVFLVFVLNKLEPESAVFASVAQYSHAYLKSTVSEYSFLKTWKKKILVDRYFKEERLSHFLTFDSTHEPIYRAFLSKVE
jgi:hypothetical protein